ncbi:MAG: ester cyclase [Brevundimonas sp.]|uniref:ester cyclase n=1 Tax=Brevundimonas sp. TaxID=1871086 RepID=UPI002488B9E7|nr:ester cyclase [Brevundimonas sp.]MDI1325855.1 ester cyclase [Brevundimonas sp.]
MLDRRTLVLSSPALALAVTPEAANASHGPDSNKALIRRFFEEVWSTGDIARRDDFLAPGYRGHMSGAPETIDRDGWTAWFQGFRTAFPDARFIVEDMIGEGDRVAARLTMRGTHQGPLNGIPATGRPVIVSGMSIERIAEGRIVEGWNENDALGMLQQLGAFPPPSA